MSSLHPRNWNLSQKTGATLVIGAGVVAVMLWYSVTEGTKALRAQQAQALEAVRTARSHYLETYFEIIEEQMRTFARNNVTIEAIDTMTRAFHLVEQQEALEPEAVDASLQRFYEEEFRPSREPTYPTWPGHDRYLPASTSGRILQAKYIADNVYRLGQRHQLKAAVGEAEYHRLHNRYHPFAREFIQSFGYYDIFLFDVDGNMIYSVMKEIDFGTNFLTGAFRDSNLAQAFRRASEATTVDSVAIVDFARYEPSYGARATFVAAPVFSYGRRLGVAAIQLPIDRVNDIMEERSGLGETGETILVGADKLMRSQSRFDDRASALETPVHSPAVDKALAGESGTVVETGYRGKEVLVSFGPIQVPGLDWAMVAQIDMDEITAPAIVLRNRIILVGIGLGLLAMLIWQILARRWLIAPLNSLLRATERVRDGNYSQPVAVVPSADEIGRLSDAFNHMSESIARDIARREAAEEELRAIIDNVPAAIFLRDLDGRFIIVNSEYESIYRVTDDSVRDRTLFDVFEHDFAETFAVHDREVIGTKQVVERELTLIPAGADRTYLALKFPVLNPQGNVIAVGGVEYDITDRKALEETMARAREAADEANRAKSEFLSNMSHELRTPLNGVLGYVQILERDDTLSEEQRECLAAIDNCGKHLLALINDVLDLSRIESGRLEIDMRPSDLHAILRSVHDIVRPRAEQKGLDLQWAIAPEIPRHIVCDGPKLRQVLVNLLGNAIKFTAQGTVSLDVTEPEPGKLCMAVTDTGIGMTADELEVIFDAFKQVEGGKTEGGTGLGLAISRRLSEALDGALEVKSEPGVGTTFCVTLPLLETEGIGEIELERATLDDAETLVLAPGQSASVLIADDRDSNRDILKRLLHRAGFSTVEAKDGVEALERMAAQDFDLVLMDIRMPRMNGVEATRRIREKTTRRPAIVIAVSASVFPDSEVQFANAGFDDFIAKPLQASELFDKIARHVDVEMVRTARAQTPAAPSTAPREISPEVAREIAARLREAAEVGDIAALNDLASELQHDRSAASCGEAIDRLAKSFDLEGMMKLADEMTAAASQR